MQAACRPPKPPTALQPAPCLLRRSRRAGAMPTNRLERFAHNLDWNLLRTFVVVVEEGSITKAANRLLLQQPAVSMALKRLEQTVGHKLIDRRPGRFDLTEAGARLHALCRDIFTSVVRLPEAMESSGEEISGHITIHTVSHALNPDWDRALASFFRLHPRVTAGVKVETTSDVIRSVERGGRNAGHLRRHHPGRARLRPVLHRDLCALLRPRPPAVRCRRYRASRNCAANPMSLHFRRAGWSAHGAGHGGPRDRLVRPAGARHRIQRRGGRCGWSSRMPVSACCPCILPRCRRASGDLWQLPPYGSLPQTETFRITNPGAALNPAERAFLAHMADVPLWQHPSA